MAVTPGEGSPVRRHKKKHYTPSNPFVRALTKNSTLNSKRDVLDTLQRGTDPDLAELLAPHNLLHPRLNKNNTNVGMEVDIANKINEIAAARGRVDDLKSPARNFSGGDVGGTARTGGGGGRAGGGMGMLDQLMQNLMSNVQGQAPSMNYQKILQSTLDDINKAYDAERKAVHQRSTKAKKETRSNRRELEDMYSSLSHVYNREAARQDQETKQDVHRVAGIYNRQASQAEKDVNRTEGQEAGLLRKLGIDAAGVETIPSGFNILEKEQSNIRKEKSKAKQIAQERGNIQERYLNKQQGLALEEGNQRSADAMAQLQDYLFQNRQALQDITSRENQATAAARTDLSAQLGEQKQAYQDAVWQRMMDVAGFGLDVRQLQSGNKFNRMNIGLDRQALIDDRKQNQFENQLDLQKLALDARDQSATEGPLAGTALGDAAQRFGTVGKQRGTKLMSVFNNVIGSPHVQDGFVMQNGEKKDMTPEMAAAIASDMGKKQGLKPHEIQLLRLQVLDYFGR